MLTDLIILFLSQHKSKITHSTISSRLYSFTESKGNYPPLITWSANS